MSETESPASGGSPAGAAGSLVAHRVEGAGDPVVLLNGGMMSMAAWEPIAGPLSRGRTVVRLDFRGQLLTRGLSPNGLTGHADDVARLLDHLRIPSAHVVGTSYGAEVGLLLSARHPRRVRSLAAIAAVDAVDDAMRAGVAAMRAACRAAVAGGPREPVYDLIAEHAFSDAWAREHAAELAARRAAVSMLPVAWFEGLDSLLATLEDLDLTEALPLVSCPVLVVLAGEDRTMPRARTEALARGLRGARLLEVPGAGHAFVAERPLAVVQILTQFLSSIDAAAAPAAPVEEP